MLDPSLDRRPFSLRARTLTIAGGVLLALAVAGAQAGFVTLDGAVRDPSGRALAAVTLVLTEPASQAKREIKSDATGRFTFVGLPPGDYTLETTSPGFRTRSERVSLAADRTLEVALAVGRLQETITVTGQPAAPPPDDPASVQRRTERQRRFDEIQAKEQARCAAAAATAEEGGHLQVRRGPAHVLELTHEAVGADHRIQCHHAAGA